ncbi:hypothetical protein I4U23_000854 [Adineta vaga]|nr:hypothetical protein I4U23_000854 [Adineta vaga]
MASFQPVVISSRDIESSELRHRIGSLLYGTLKQAKNGSPSATIDKTWYSSMLEHYRFILLLK